MCRNIWYGNMSYVLFLTNILIWKILKTTEELNKVYREHLHNYHLDAVNNI